MQWEICPTLTNLTMMEVFIKVKTQNCSKQMTFINTRMFKRRKTKLTHSSLIAKIEGLQSKNSSCQNMSTPTTNLKSPPLSKSLTGLSLSLSTIFLGTRLSLTNSQQKSVLKSTLARLETQWLSTMKFWEQKKSTKSISLGNLMKHSASFSNQLHKKTVWVKQCKLCL